MICNGEDFVNGTWNAVAVHGANRSYSAARQTIYCVIVSFTCDLIESSVGGHDQTVTVRKDRIEIVTDDVLALQALSLKYVALTCN